jgi:minor curlin subunit
MKIASSAIAFSLSLASAVSASPAYIEQSPFVAGQPVLTIDTIDLASLTTDVDAMLAPLAEADLPAASVLQSGLNNQADLIQTGTDNLGLIVQNGFNNSANLLQAGSSNMAVLHQVGFNNAASVSQMGNNHRAVVSQRGTGNVAVIRQY